MAKDPEVKKQLHELNEKMDELQEVLAKVAAPYAEIADYLERFQQIVGNYFRLMDLYQRHGAISPELVVPGLRDSISPSLGLAGTLAEYLQKFGRQNKISARMVVGHGMTPRLAPAVEVQLVRVIQEALANVRKHARARNAWVRFEQDEQWAMVTIEDDGCGFDLATVQVRQGQRFGIATMRERVEGVGGSLEIDTTAGRGTKVIVRLPTSSEESAEWNR